MRIYIGCGMTHVPRNLFTDYANTIHQMAKVLEGHQVTYAFKNSDPQLAGKPFHEKARLCYVWDRDFVLNADVMIAEATFPSIGLGIEMQIAHAASIPIVICFQGTNKVQPVKYTNPDSYQHDLQIGEGHITLMALGIPSVVKVVKYTTDNLDAIVSAANEAVLTWA